MSGGASGPCPLELLTERERECVALVARHWRTREIAGRLALSPETVDEYVSRAARKIGARDRADAARRLAACACGGCDALDRFAPARRSWRVERADLLRLLRLALGGLGVVAGVAMLATAVGEAGRAIPELIEVLLLLARLAAPLALILAGLGFGNGGYFERVAVAFWLSLWALTAPGAPPVAMMAADLVFAAVVLGLAMIGRRPALRVAAALHVVTALAHVAPGPGGELAIAVVVHGCDFGALSAILYSALTRAGDRTGSPALSEPEPPCGSLEILTPREREVIGLAAAHLRTQEIAARLGLSPEIVDEHVGRAVRKLGAGDRASAIRLYLEIGGAPGRP